MLFQPVQSKSLFQGQAIIRAGEFGVSVSWRNLAGALAMGGLGFWALAALLATGKLYFLLLAVRDSYLAVVYLRRPDPDRTGNYVQAGVSIVATCIALLYSCRSFVEPSQVSLWLANLLAVLGYSIAAMAAVDLGKRFSVVPSFRGSVCREGVYRYFRHPMYLGYAIAEFGWLLIDSANATLFLSSVLLQSLRAKFENEVLEESISLSIRT